MEGIIMFMLENKQSKSEMVAPFLYQGQGQFVRVRMKEENPFENNTLQAYDGKMVVLNGEMDDDLFLISEISEKCDLQVAQKQEEKLAQDNAEIE